jgi:hypothetical protein
MRDRSLLIWVVAVTAVLFRGESNVSARDRLTITVDPNVAVSPATVWIRTEVEPDASNRALEIIVDSAEFFSSSEVRLDGEHTSRVSALKLRDLPAGEYRITATLTAADGQRWVANQNIQVH